MTFENFYAGNTYNFAVTMAKAISTAPCGKNSPLIFYGQYGVGKTHLLSAIEYEVKVQYPCFDVIHTTAQDLIAEYVEELKKGNNFGGWDKYCKDGILLIDNFEFVVGKRNCQDELCNLFEKCALVEKQVVLAINGDLYELEFERGIQNWLNIGINFEMKMPDKETKLEIAKGFARELSITPDEETLQCIVRESADVSQIKGHLKYKRMMSDVMTEYINMLEKQEREESVPRGEVTDVKIYLLDWNQTMVDAWNKYFSGIEHVESVCDNFGNFMEKNEVQCVVSPANSFGLMEGGYDYAITEYFGNGLKESVQKYILENYGGEQMPGTAFIIDIPNFCIATDETKKLIHCPTMREPSAINNESIIYHCMRSCLLLAKKNHIKSIVIPAFGGGCGYVEPDLIAKLMKKAYDQIRKPPLRLDWEYVNSLRLM